MDKYDSMTALYADPDNVEGTTYGKRWRRHEWSQMVEEQVTDNPETQTIVMALHGGGIEPGTSEIAIAAAGYHPARLMPATDGQGLHDFWIFEGLLSKDKDKLHVTASNYNEPIATELVQNAHRCLSLHGCSHRQAKVSSTHPMGSFRSADSIPNFGISSWQNSLPHGFRLRMRPRTNLKVKIRRTSAIGHKSVVASNWRWGGAIVRACLRPIRARDGNTRPTTTFDV